MKVAWVEGLSRPYIKDDTLYLPCSQRNVRWEKVTAESTVAVVLLTWGNDSRLDDDGWITEWVFFKGEREIPWDEVQDKVSVARSFREWNYHPDDVIPWGDDLEVLVALEQA